MDPAKVTDQIAKYTGEHFSDFEIRKVIRGQCSVIAFLISPVLVSIVLIEPGTHPLPDGKQQRLAFSKGTVYFRNGAKSEPGNTNDLRCAIERHLTNIRKSWLKGIKKPVRPVLDPNGRERRHVWQRQRGDQPLGLSRRGGAQRGASLGEDVAPAARIPADECTSRQSETDWARAPGELRQLSLIAAMDRRRGRGTARAARGLGCGRQLAEYGGRLDGHRGETHRMG
jgi:hypothetical protein